MPADTASSLQTVTLCDHPDDIRKRPCIFYTHIHTHMYVLIYVYDYINFKLQFIHSPVYLLTPIKLYLKSPLQVACLFCYHSSIIYTVIKEKVY